MTMAWTDVKPLPALNGNVGSALSQLDELRRIWAETVDAASTDDFAEIRRRTLRRHAVETGIIERLYSMDYGVTEALVADGLTLEAAAREGSITEGTLAVIRDQYDALEYLAECVRDGVPLTIHFVRELHQIITRHQPTYEKRASGASPHASRPSQFAIRTVGC